MTMCDNRNMANTRTLFRHIHVSTGFVRSHDLQQRWQDCTPDYMGAYASTDGDLARDVLDALTLGEYGSYCGPQHPAGLGRHWTSSREYAFRAARSNAGSTYSLVIEAEWDGEREDAALTGVGSDERGHYVDEAETTLLPGARVRVVALSLYGDPYQPPVDVLSGAIDAHA